MEQYLFILPVIFYEFLAISVRSSHSTPAPVR